MPSPISHTRCALRLVGRATLHHLEGAQATGTGEGGEVIILGEPASLGREARVTQTGDYRFFAGWRSDPFFFDAGAFNNSQFVGADFFADKDMRGSPADLVIPIVWSYKRVSRSGYQSG